MSGEATSEESPALGGLTAGMRAASRGIAALVAATGGLALVGWARDIDVLERVADDHAAVRPVTAVAFTAGGVALWLAHHDDRRAAVARMALGALVTLAGTVALLEHAFDVRPGFGLLLFTSEQLRAGAALPGRLPPQTAAMLLLLGLALLGFPIETPARRRPAEGLALLASFGGWLGVIGCLYGASPLFGVGGPDGVAVHVPPTCLLLATGILFARPDRGLMRVVTSDTSGGLLARKLLPLAAALPVVLGFAIVTLGSRASLYDVPAGAALLVATTTALFAALVLATARALDRADRERRRAEDARASAAAELATTAAELKRAVATRDEFLSVASHELRTPLTALKLQLDAAKAMMAKDPRSADARFAKKVATALRQTDRMTQLIDGLLDVSRIAMGRFRLKVEDFDAVELVREIVARLDDEARAAGCELVLEAPSSVVGRWDRFRLEQVLVHLVGNAIKYGTGKPVYLRVVTADDRVELVVRDEGIGIAEQDLERIFGRFERAAPLRHYGGLGLGLYITHQIASAHGGAIRVRSKRGEGATFVVSLPRWTPPADDVSVPSLPSVPAHGPPESAPEGPG